MSENTKGAVQNEQQDDAPVWDERLDALLEGTVDAGGEEPASTPPHESTEETDGASTESGELGEMPGDDDPEGQLAWFKKKFGESQNMMGEWRRKAQALEQRLLEIEGKVQEASEPDPADPEIQKENFAKFMRAVDPNWDVLSGEVAGYEDDRRPLYNTALMLFGELAKVKAEVQAMFQKQEEQTALAKSGVSEEIVNKMTGNPTLAPLWEAATLDQKIEMAKAFGASAGSESAGPSDRGPSGHPKPTRSTMIESSGASYGRSAGVGNSTGEKVVRALDENNLEAARHFVDELLRKDLAGGTGWPTR